MNGILCQDDKALDYFKKLDEKPYWRVTSIATDDYKYEQWKEYQIDYSFDKLTL